MALFFEWAGGAKGGSASPAESGRKFFFNWKTSEKRAARLPHIRFRLVAAVLLIMTCVTLLMRFSASYAFAAVLVPTFIIMLLLITTGTMLIFSKHIIFSKVIVLATVFLFEVIAFEKSPIFNLTPLTPQIGLLVLANLALIYLVSRIGEQ